MSDFKPGEQVLLALVVPQPGHNEMGDDGNAKWVEPSFSGIIGNGTVTADAKYVTMPGQEEKMEIEPNTVFHLEDRDKALVALETALDLLKG